MDIDTKKTGAVFEQLKKLYLRYDCSEISIPLLLKQSGANPFFAAGEDPFVKLIGRAGDVQLLRPDATLHVLDALSRAEKHVSDRIYYFTEIARYGEEKIEEILQTGAEVFGDPSLTADAEIIRLAIESIQTLGIHDVRVDLGHGAFISELIRTIPFLKKTEETVLHGMFSRKNAVDMEEFLVARNVPALIIDTALSITSLYGSYGEVFAKAAKLCLSPGMTAALGELEELSKLLDESGIGESTFFDLSFSNRMDYYSGVIFKVYTAQATRTVINGGRYDEFASRFSSVKHAVGFGHHLDVTMPLAHLGDLPSTAVAIKTPVMNQSEALLLASRLRDAGHAVSVTGAAELSVRFGSKTFSSLDEASAFFDGEVMK